LYLLYFILDAERPSIRFSKRQIEDYERTDFQLTIGDSLTAIVGSTVTIQCNATGNPPPQVQWFKSGALISSAFSIKASNNTLRIYAAMWSDTGEYECLAVNAAGSDKKTSFIKFVRE
jgi:hemicentin